MAVAVETTSVANGGFVGNLLVAKAVVPTVAEDAAAVDEAVGEAVGEAAAAALVAKEDTTTSVQS